MAEQPDNLLPIGTRIRFQRTLDKPADSDSPAQVYAWAGELGEITGYGCCEGYWVKTDRWPTPFGASPEEFEVVGLAAVERLRDTLHLDLMFGPTTNDGRGWR
jgi:hypothetical protein